MLRLEQATNKRQRMRSTFSAYAALIAAPGNLATGVTLPALADLHVSTTSALAAVDALVSINGSDKFSPPAAANAVHRLGSAEAGRSVVKAAGAPGTVRLYVRGPSGALHKIAEG